MNVVIHSVFACSVYTSCANNILKMERLIIMRFGMQIHYMTQTCFFHKLVILSYMFQNVTGFGIFFLIFLCWLS